MSALNTFLFEEIATGPLVNKDSLIYPTKKHKNASGAYVRIAYRKGRYGQTEGRVLGDINGHIPACPYHMPRNIKRYNEPHLHISKKVLGDIIEAKDINNLIDKIRLFQYAWEAEANNIYGYNAVTGYPNAKVDISKLTYIESDGAPQPAFNIHDSKISGTIQNQIPKVANIFSCGGSSLASVVSQLNTAVANKTKTFTSFGTVLHHGFPEFMDDLNSYDNHTLIHAGHSPIVGVKAIQYMEAGKVSPNFKLQYLSGDKVADGGTENGHVKGKDNQDMIFNYNTAYVISYLQDNQPNTQPKYYGFILYYLGNDIVNNLPETEIVTETVITPATYGISSFGTQAKKLFGTDLKIDTTKSIIPAVTTQAIAFDVAKSLSNIQITDTNESYVADAPGDTFWAQMVPMEQYQSYHSYKARVDAVKAQFNALPNKVVKIPAQKIADGKCWRQLTNGSWVEQDAIYILHYLEATNKVKDVSYHDYGDNTVTDYTYAAGFNIYAAKWSPNTGKVQWNDAEPFKTFRSIPYTGSLPNWFGAINCYDFDDAFFNDPIGFMIPKTFTGSNNPDNSSSGFPYFLNNFVAFKESIYSEDGTTIRYTHFNELGVASETYDNPIIASWSSVGQIRYFYTVGQSCSDGSAPVNGQCSITTTTVVTIANTIDTTAANIMTLTEKDITYKKGIYFVGEKSYPQIKTADFKNIKNVLSKFITNIITLSQSQINNGTSDSETYQELSTFLSNQAASSGTYDPEDPDTSFEGYDIRQNSLIKLNFYNILVDAYKLIINGCICNADCACNLVCACNTNCGCNYDD